MSEKRKRMKALRGLLVISLVFVMTGSAFAGWFDFSDEDYAACNQKYFGKPEATVEDFMALDLSNIDNKNDAKMLFKTIEPMVEPFMYDYEALEDRCEALEPAVKHFFDVLYAKEIHDELWESTRQLKKAAYKKVLTEYNQTFAKFRSTGTSLVQVRNISSALKKISKQFKEIELTQ